MNINQEKTIKLEKTIEVGKTVKIKNKLIEECPDCGHRQFYSKCPDCGYAPVLVYPAPKPEFSPNNPPNPPVPVIFRKTQVTIIQQGESLTSKNAIEVSIRDDGAGEFLKITRDDEAFTINPEEVTILCAALRYLGKECR